MESTDTVSKRSLPSKLTALSMLGESGLQQGGGSVLRLPSLPGVRKYHKARGFKQHLPQGAGDQLRAGLRPPRPLQPPVLLGG